MLVWGCGGTGRHAWLRTKCRKAWGFDSLHPYQIMVDKFTKLNFYIYLCAMNNNLIQERRVSAL